MTKKLRSCILERIPFDLRVEIELLSRRRDLISKEKLEELIKLFRASKLDIIPIGPGTNRYGFKLDGFAVKIATNDEGKIDNLKEFKMAKRLYPYVIQVHEVSSNGSILVCEYIQPFISYSEMCMYSDQIKKILKELSSVYLIGDVGINPQNYGNWGLRMGTSDPVCLDFAYVYSVSSSLFRCIKTNCKGVMVPDDDFIGLHCNICKKDYSFQDIRARLANDLHSLEIGDLTEEGYELKESDTIVELDVGRSNYLLNETKKTKKPKEETIETEEEIPFVMDHPIRNYEEENTMSIARIISVTSKLVENGNIDIPKMPRAIATPKPKVEPTVEKAELSSVYGELLDTNVYVDENPFYGRRYPTKTGNAVVDAETTEEVAFSANITTVKPKKETITPEVAPAETEKETVPTVEEPAVAETKEEHKAEEPVVEQKPPVAEKAPKKEETAAKPNVNVSVTVKKSPQPETKPEEAPKKKNFDDIDEFKDAGDLLKATSDVAFRINDYCKEKGLYDQIRTDLVDKRVFKEGFYKTLGGSIYVTLMLFQGFISTDVPNNNRPGTHKVFTPPSGSVKGTEHEPTMIFMQRYYNTREVNQAATIDGIMVEYKQRYNDYHGIQIEWMKPFLKNLSRKINISDTGIAIIKNMISDFWCTQNLIITPVVKPSSPTPSDTGAAVEPPEKDEDDMSIPDEEEETVEVEGAVEPDDEDDDDEECECCGSLDYISVYVITNDNGVDTIRLNVPDEYGEISIPMYVKLDEIVIGETDQEFLENGSYDWLRHQVPVIMFKTDNPAPWVEANKIPFYDDIGAARYVILGKDEDDMYILGLYYMEGMFIDSEGPDEEGPFTMITDYILLEKLNRIIGKTTGGYSSHLWISLSRKDLIHDEQYMHDLIEQEKKLKEAESELNAINAALSNAGPDSNLVKSVASQILSQVQSNANGQNETNGNDMMITPIRHKSN